jgi:hypothetical protein
MVSVIPRLFEKIYEQYWVIYKAHVPQGHRCLDEGPEFVKKLTVFGKLLYLIRPLMIRKKIKNKSGFVCHLVPRNKPKKVDIADYVYNPTHTKLYYSLIGNSLQTVSPAEVRYINAVTQCPRELSHPDGTLIQYSQDDQPYFDQWLNTRTMAYFLVQETCLLPTFDKLQLTDSIKVFLNVNNAGGSSEISEIVSMYYMQKRYGATHFIPEMSVQYDTESKICDYLMNINGYKIGVSVTRAILYPFERPINETFTTSLLYRKMTGILLAKRSVAPEHAFHHSMIHIWCRSQSDIDMIKTSYQKIIDQDYYDLYKGIYIFCSLCVTDFIYTNKPQV